MLNYTEQIVFFEKKTTARSQTKTTNLLKNKTWQGHKQKRRTVYSQKQTVRPTKQTRKKSTKRIVSKKTYCGTPPHPEKYIFKMLENIGPQL